MRKHLKNSILEIIKTLYEAHKSVKSLIEKGKSGEAELILGDCQNTAVQIGEAIDSSEGEGSAVIPYLEEYCEAVYAVFTSAADKNSGAKAQKTLDRSLVKAENSIKKDIKIKLEIVFLPYKASMWDSLESVWKSAEDDPECDAYVVPIPYYDRKSDGSFGQYHYEGSEFPEYVTVIDYKSYDFEKRKPDIIYIHNPYDDGNYVTSIDPRFYSKELKKYTDKLIYIPYFVLGDINPNDEKALESISHFVLTPGVLNADEVIVQSEAMKKAYINVILKYTKSNAEVRAYLENKIKGTGSPKLDKAAKTKKEDIIIPEKWKKYLYKPDGTMKKVILYNNSVTALLENDIRMINKICSVLDTFYINRNDITLLWRPHPLMKATIESMRPYLWEKYSAIVNQYIRDDWGIFDDTADLNRAIALSDAYYGDMSSLVELCITADKPVMIQNAGEIV